MIHGIAFDLDGTLLDSRLDFDAMRREMGLVGSLPILEAIDQLPPREAERCRDILHRHELAGAERALPMPGVEEFLTELSRLRWRGAIVTRNSRNVTQAMLAKLPFEFFPVITRDDGPVKPSPWPVLEVCRVWSVEPRTIAMLGDYHFDLASGRAAGARTVFYSAGRDPSELAWSHLADHVLPCFSRADELLESLRKSL